MVDEKPIAADHLKRTTELAKRIHNISIQLTETVSAKRNDRVAIISLATQGTILELADAALNLISRNSTSAAETILRSMLDAFANLLLLSKNADHLMTLQMDHHKEWLKILKAASRKDNEFLDSISNIQELPQLILDRQIQIKELAKRGAKPLIVEQTFASAGITELYDGIYRRLSSSVHHGLGEVLRRHLVAGPDGIESLIMFKEPTDTTKYMIIDTISGILLQTTALFNTSLTDANKSYLEDLRAQRDSLNNEMQEQSGTT